MEPTQLAQMIIDVYEYPIGSDKLINAVSWISGFNETGVVLSESIDSHYAGFICAGQSGFCIKISNRIAPLWTVRGIFVNQKYRRLGIGSALVLRCLKYYFPINLLEINHRNLEAKAFWKSLFEIKKIGQSNDYGSYIVKYPKVKFTDSVRVPGVYSLRDTTIGLVYEKPKNDIIRRMNRKITYLMQF